jgi:hypothetical protein
VSCHQNHGPIFSRQLWLETNANPQIAARLEKQRSEFHGIAARGTADIANAIDDSTDRANRLALLQQLWREGCGDGDAGDQCRRGVFIASLQFGLTGGRTYDSAAQSFQHDVIDRLQGNAQLKWPSGIAVPDADIINRDPLMLPEDSAPSALAHVPAQFEPLLPRAPLEILTPDGRLLADQLVKGIAGFASAAARDELDRTLRQRARGDDSFDVEVPCEIIETADRVAFDCGPERMRLTGSMQGSEGTLDALSMPGSDPIRHLQITSIDRRFDATRKSVSFKAHDHGRAARLPDGNAIGTITLRWPPAAVDRPKSGSATIRIHADFAAVSAAIRTVAGPIRSSAIDEVAASLRGSRAARWRDEMRPITTVAKRPQDGKNIATPALVFEPECGNCHHSDEITPPNFLAGDAKRVTAALDACAPRIFVRLAMQDLPPAERDKTPMPPEPALLPGQVRTVPSARTSASLSAVRRAVEERLRIQYGRVPTAGELLQHGYENLRPCLPPSG